MKFRPFVRPVAFAALGLLGACASPEIRTERVGTALVEVRPAAEVAQRCAQVLRGYMGCAAFRLPLHTADDSAPAVANGMTIPAGFQCHVIAPPVERQINHEMRHCAEGAWHL